ncbi:hypothetical protein Ahy_A04g018505 [Arachis hypogaea]|uniref:Aminotransferase-like plant mobile domain-containing protein n=1 Tax=Arachis hypogaea TaxID=3818 RepID=A0A445DDT4_ARAHY|nr:hypothetical protein Ahy_A04g018505 [Arachis hypogaea]
MACADARHDDINCLNATWHIVGAINFQLVGKPRLPLRRASHTLASSDAIVLYMNEVGFGDTVQLRDFMFNNSLITAFCSETHTFHLSWDEYTITVQDVTYHLRSCTHGEAIVPNMGVCKGAPRCLASSCSATGCPEEGVV